MTTSEFGNLVWRTNENGGSGQSARFKFGFKRLFPFSERPPVVTNLGYPGNISRSRFALRLFRRDAGGFALGYTRSGFPLGKASCDFFNLR